MSVFFPPLPVVTHVAPLSAAGCTFDEDSDPGLCEYRQGQDDDFDWQLIRTYNWLHPTPDLLRGRLQSSSTVFCKLGVMHISDVSVPLKRSLGVFAATFSGCSFEVSSRQRHCGCFRAAGGEQRTKVARVLWDLKGSIIKHKLSCAADYLRQSQRLAAKALRKETKETQNQIKTDTEDLNVCGSAAELSFNQNQNQHHVR